MKNNYQMITVYEYVKLLDGEKKEQEKKTLKLRENVEQYLLKARKAARNAKILETLLA